MKCKILNISDQLIIKVPLMLQSDKDEPFYIIKMNKSNNLYRVSLNYEHINKLYGLRINFIRNLEKVSNRSNKLFKISNDKISINPDFKLLNNLYKIEKDEAFIKNFEDKINCCKIIKYSFIDKYDSNGVTTIFIIKRDYENDCNFSILFSSVKFYNIDDFLATI